MNELEKTLKDAIEYFEHIIENPDEVIKIEESFESKYFRQLRDRLLIRGEE